MLHLRQATASQAVLIGPFVDSTDGNTAETGLTIDAADIRLSVNGGNIAAKNSGGGTHDELGYYTITLDATDTATVGRLQLMVHESGALPVYHEYEVLEEAAYDAIYAASAAPATAAALATVDSNVDAILVDTAEIGAAGAGLTAVVWNADWDAEVQSEVTDALNAYDPPTRAEATADKAEILNVLQGLVLETGTIGDTGNSTTALHLDGLTYGDDEINNYLLVIFDNSASEYHARFITNWDLSSEVATVATLPFTPEDSVDTYWLLSTQSASAGSLTAAEVADAVWEEAQADHADAGTFGVIATEIASILTDTGTDGVVVASIATGAITAAAIADNAIDAATFAADVNAEILSYIVDDATRIDASALNTASVTTIPAILTDTAEIGAAGAGLSNITWNADWDAEVQSEVTDALNAYDPPTRAELTSDIGTVTTAISGLENISAADVNAQVVDVLNTDTFAEPGQGTPGATITLAAKIGYLYKAWRNRTTQTADEYALYADDATTKDHEAVVSDDGTTFERGEISTGA